MKMKKQLMVIKLYLIIQPQWMKINLMAVKEKVYSLELGKDLFLKGFDEQLIGVKKMIQKN